MDGQTITNVAAIGCATVATCAGLIAFCLQPTQGSMIAAILGPFVALCGTAWQAARSQSKQPGA